MNEKVSIIMPVYNAEKTLDRIIKKIITQTYKNIELILINDGSTDMSLTICEKFQKIDNRIKIINKQNTGVGDTRNKGIEKSTGTYLCFIDSDDIISENYIEELYKTIYRTKSDYVTSKVVCVDGDHSFLPYYNKENNLNIYNQENYINKYLNFKVSSAVWGKLYLKRQIKKIKFKEININEDFYYSWEVVMNCSRFTENNNAIYYYQLDSVNSLTKKQFSRSNMNIINHIETVLEDIRQKYPHLIEDGYNYYNAFILHTLLLYFNYISSENCSDLLLDVKDILVEKAKLINTIKNPFITTENNILLNDLINQINNKTLTLEVKK